MVMARFSIRHWYMHEDLIEGIKSSVHMDQGTCQLRKVRRKSVQTHVYVIIYLILGRSKMYHTAHMKFFDICILYSRRYET